MSIISKDFTIGIDPGIKSGCARYCTHTRRIVETRTLDFWSVITYVEGFDESQVLIVVENSNLAKYTFKERLGAGGYGARKSRNVGSNQRESQLLVDGLRRRGYEVREVKPNPRIVKWNATYFTRVTGLTGASNSHVRDAARLALIYSSSPHYFEKYSTR